MCLHAYISVRMSVVGRDGEGWCLTHEPAAHAALQVLSAAGFATATEQMAGTVVMGLAKTASIAVGLVLFDRAGRRVMLLLSTLGCSACLLLLALSISAAQVRNARHSRMKPCTQPPEDIYLRARGLRAQRGLRNLGIHNKCKLLTLAATTCHSCRRGQRQQQQEEGEEGMTRARAARGGLCCASAPSWRSSVWGSGQGFRSWPPRCAGPSIPDSLISHESEMVSWLCATSTVTIVRPLARGLSRIPC